MQTSYLITETGTEKDVKEILSSRKEIQARHDKKGILSELMVVRELINRRCYIFLPLQKESEVDLIAQTPTGKFWRVQVKSGNLQHTITKYGKRCGPYLIFPVTRGAFKKGLPRANYTHVDVFIAVIDETCWIVPHAEVVKRNTFSTFSIKPECEFKNAWHLMGLA